MTSGLRQPIADRMQTNRPDGVSSVAESGTLRVLFSASPEKCLWRPVSDLRDGKPWTPPGPEGSNGSGAAGCRNQLVRVATL